MIEELFPGSMFDDRYEIVEMIGEGGMGKIYKAIEVELGRTVALKFIHRDLLAENDSFNRFRREGNALSRLQHPGIVAIYRFGIWQESLAFIVMELVAGRSLRATLDAQGSLPSLETAILGQQLCSAMQHAHLHNIVHRDLKPGNILITRQPEDEEVKVKVIDFGLARVVSDTTTRQQLTQTGMLIGSVYYMSPEQCTGKKADARSDIYALGCVLYECLTGHPPFSADTPIGLMNLHVNEDIPLLSTAAVPIANAQAWDALLHRALQKEPNKRFQSMSEFEEGITAVLSGSFTGILTVPSEPAGRAKRRAPYLIPIVVSLVVLAFVIAVKVSLQTDSKKAVSGVNNAPGSKLRPINSTVATADLVYTYRDRRGKIESDRRIQMLKDWIDRFGTDDPTGASIANFWLCLETADRAESVKFASMRRTLEYNIPERAELTPLATVYRDRALSGLQAALKLESQNTDKQTLLYFIDVLEMLDMPPDQRVKKCLGLLDRKDRANRFPIELREELKRIYNRAGDFPAEEKLLRLELGEYAESSILLINNLAQQNRLAEGRNRLRQELDDLLGDRWTSGYLRRIHYLCQLLYSFKMIPEARKAVAYCKNGSEAIPLSLSYEENSRPCRNKNQHHLLQALLLAEDNKKAEALAELEQIDLKDGLARRQLFAPLVFLVMKLGGRPGPFMGTVVKASTSDDIKWIAPLSKRLRPVRPLAAAGLEHTALTLIRHKLKLPKATIEDLTSVALLLLHTPQRSADLKELLNQAEQTFLEQEQRESGLAVSILKIESQIDHGNYDAARQELEKILPAVSSSKSRYSKQLLADALACKARIATATHESDQARSEYTKILKLIDHSYDLSLEHKVNLLNQFADFCDEVGDQQGAQTARAKSKRIAPEEFRELRERALYE